MKYAIGCDFGTLSMRAVLVSIEDGGILAEQVYDYSNAVITDKLPDTGTVLHGLNWALQDPDDYLRALRECIPAVVKTSGVDKKDIIGVGVDFTTCTVMPMDRDGNVLCQRPEYRDRPHAWVKLWKNHTATDEAELITEFVAKNHRHELDNYGFRASPEWFFPKVWEVLREDKEIYDAADTFIEAGDYVVYKLTGHIARSGILAAAKGLYDNEKHSFPDKSFFGGLDKRFENVIEEKHIDDNILCVGSSGGGVSAEMAAELGLCEGTPVCVAHADAAVALVGAGIVHPNEIIFAMGTSTCHIVMSEKKVAIPGMFGTYMDGVLPGYFTYEAGQGAVGDIFDWFCSNLAPRAYAEEAEKRGIVLQKLMDEKAARLGIGESGIVALDWENGNRCILQDGDLTGMLMGLTLSTKAEEVYRALIEATAFGTKVIMDQFEKYDVPIEKIFCCGGLAHKSEFVMQVYADVLDKDMIITAVKQTSALSSAIFASVAGGGFGSYEEAVAHMVKPPKRVYKPIPENVAKYKELFAIYRELHDQFGAADSSMKRLRAIQKQAHETR